MALALPDFPWPPPRYFAFEVLERDWLAPAAGGRLGVTGTAPIAGWGGTFFICQDNLSGSFARQIDIAMDDGLPASRTIRLLANGASNGTAIAPADLTDAGIYTVCAAY